MINLLREIPSGKFLSNLYSNDMPYAQAVWLTAHKFVITPKGSTFPKDKEILVCDIKEFFDEHLDRITK